MNVLDDILASTRASLADLAEERGRLEKAVASAPSPPDLATALGGDRVALIAEVKRRSPSAGTINNSLDPRAQARAYADGGAAAVSVLTDTPFFGGSMADLEQVVATVSIPVLRKDFIVDEVQILQARAAGAAALLLIVRALPQVRLLELLQFTSDLGMAALVETHDRNELDRALDTPARVIGVNARNLDTFVVNSQAAWQLLASIPSDRLAIAESGMKALVDVESAARAGADAVLIGGALAASSHPGHLAAEFSGVSRRGR